MKYKIFDIKKIILFFTLNLALKINVFGYVSDQDLPINSPQDHLYDFIDWQILFIAENFNGSKTGSTTSGNDSIGVEDGSTNSNTASNGSSYSHIGPIGSNINSTGFISSSSYSTYSELNHSGSVNSNTGSNGSKIAIIGSKSGSINPDSRFIGLIDQSIGTIGSNTGSYESTNRNTKLIGSKSDFNGSINRKNEFTGSINQNSKINGSNLGFTGPLSSSNTNLKHWNAGSAIPIHVRFPVDASISKLQIKIKGKLKNGFLYTPNGEHVDIGGQRNTMKKNLLIHRRNNSTLVTIDMKNSDVDKHRGIWTLKAEPKNVSSVKILAASELQWTPVLSNQGQEIILTNLNDPLITGRNREGINSSFTITEVLLVGCESTKDVLWVTKISIPWPDAGLGLKVEVPDVSKPFAVAIRGRDDFGYELYRQHDYCFNRSDSNEYKNKEFHHSDITRRETPHSSNIVNQDKTFMESRSLLRDTVPPMIYVMSMSSCEDYLKRKNCDEETWSAAIHVVDRGIGLLSVQTEPSSSSLAYVVPGQPRLQFVHSGICCEPEVRVIATDLQGNTNSIEISAGRLHPTIPVWAIIVITLVCLLILILLILAILCCAKARKKNGRDNIVLTRTRKH